MEGYKEKMRKEDQNKMKKKKQRMDTNLDRKIQVKNLYTLDGN